MVYILLVWIGKGILTHIFKYSIAHNHELRVNIIRIFPLFLQESLVFGVKKWYNVGRTYEEFAPKGGSHGADGSVS
jgi:hypothetical protein